MVKLDNPAGKLFAIFEKAKQGGGAPTRIRLANILGSESDAPEAVVAALVDLYQLVNDAERKAALPEVAGFLSNEFISRAFPQIRRVISMWLAEMETQWNPNHASSIDFSSLEACSEVLSNHFAEKAITDHEKESILESIDGLTAQVAESSLSKEMKFSLLEGLTELRRVMIEYPTVGVRPVRRAAATIGGDLIINYNQIDKNDKTQKSVWDAAVALIDLVNKATTLAEKLLPVASVLLLGSGH